MEGLMPFYFISSLRSLGEGENTAPKPPLVISLVVKWTFLLEGERKLAELKSTPWGGKKTNRDATLRKC